jgi:SAM-dependent methyltransferase
MGFEVGSDAYAQFMGRYAEPLAAKFADFADVKPGDRAIDVGCGPGALAAVLVERLGADAVAAIDPSPPFVEAIRSRLPGVDVRRGPAESLPYDDGTFDQALAQLVVSFMTNPVAGLAEMARVTKPGGVVTACVWDLAGGRAPISPFWRAARQLDSTVVDESHMAGASDGDLVRLAVAAGLDDVEPMELSVRVSYPTFDAWWEPYTLGVGPAGDHVASLDEAGRAALRDECRSVLPEAPFDITAVAWAVRGRV